MLKLGGYQPQKIQSSYLKKLVLKIVQCNVIIIIIIITIIIIVVIVVVFDGGTY